MATLTTASESSVRTISSFLNALSLCLMLNYIILQPLEEDAEKMKHWDPTQIIDALLPSDSLGRFVGYASLTTFFFSFLSFSHDLYYYYYLERKQRWETMICRRIIFESCRGILVGFVVILCVSTSITLFVFFLCGDNPFEHILQSLFASYYVTLLSLGSSSLLRPGTPVTTTWTRYFRSDSSDDIQRLMDDSRNILWQVIIGGRPLEFFSSILILIPCMILRILDHGMQIQRWPVPVLLGITAGFTIGNILSVLMALVLSAKVYLRKRKDHNMIAKEY